MAFRMIFGRFQGNSSLTYHSLLTELLVAGYSALGNVYKMLMLKIRPQKCHYHTFIDDGM